MSEWKETTLGELIKCGCADLQTGPFGTMLSASEYCDIGIPVIAVQDIGNNALRHGKLVYVNEETANRLKKYQVKKGDIIFGRKGAVDKRALIKEEESGWIQGSDCIRLRLDNTIDYKFVSYQFGTDKYKEWMMQFSTGATMPSLNQEILRLLPLLLPTLPEQKAIATVLSSLDDKIDLLHRQNKTLEAMAETLFRQWFIEEAEDNWEEICLGEYFPIVTGKKDANYSTVDGEYPFFTCSQSVLKSPNYSFDGSAILLAGNGDFSIKRYKGKFEAYQRTYVLMPKNENYFDFLYIFMKYYLDEITGGHQGSVINFITKGMIHDFIVLLPRDKSLLFDKFRKFTDIYSKVDFNLTQIRTLEKLRDTLLPKLMSGEVRVEA
jgi:type I restriction enzyme S subunit